MKTNVPSGKFKVWMAQNYLKISIIFIDQLT